MKKTTMFMNAAIIAVFTLCSMNAAAQQLKTPAPSPSQTVKQDFALSDITIDYSRPGVKGRVIYGDLVPFGKAWRTGANGSTKITFGENVKVEGNAIAAGTYAIYTIPNKDSWEIVFNKDLTLGANVADYKTENDVIRFKVKPTALANKVETFTINVADVTTNTANVELLWEQTRVAFNVAADIDTQIMKEIENAVVKDNKPYYQAARYYYDNDKDLKQALAWADKALAQNAKAYWVVLLKAKIQLKAKDNKGAIVSAEKVVALAKEGKNDDYVKMGEALIAEAKK